MNGQEIVKQINVRLAEIGMTKQTFSQREKFIRILPMLTRKKI